MRPTLPPRRILVVRNDRMGDLLMSLPAVRQIRSAFPEAKVTLLIRQELEPLLEGHPDVDRILLWDPGQGPAAAVRWGRRLRRERFDCALILNPSKLFHAASFLAGIPVRAGYRRKWGFLLNRSIPDTKQKRAGHEADYNLEPLSLLGIRPSEPVLELPVRPELDAQALRLMESHGIRPLPRPVAIHPWTSNPAKSWPLESFLEVAGGLSRSGRPVLLIGEPSPVRGELDELRANGVVDLTGKVPLRILPALLRRCGLLISNDSGPAHVAAAVGTPTVVVAPREHEAVLRRWKPLGKEVRVLLSPDPSTVEKAALSFIEGS